MWIEDGQALNDLVRLWDPATMDVALLLAQMNRTTGFDGAGDFFMGADNRLTFRNEAPAAPLNYMGVHITRPQIVDAVAEDAFSLAKIWRELAPRGRLAGSLMDGDWMHVGDPQALAEAELRLQKL